MSPARTHPLQFPYYVRWLASTTVVAVVLLAAGDASSFQRTQTCSSFGTFECDPGEEPKPIAWPIRCIEYRINEQGSKDFSGDGLTPQLREYVRESFAAWREPDCSDFQAVEGDPTENATVEYDQSDGWTGNMNLVVWRDDEWPHMSGRHSFALTSVTYKSSNGRIIDADIELNTAESTYTYFEESRVGETDKVDLGNALTHEVGHFLGLDHSSEREATMYSSARSGEIKKRSLERDDIRGLCAIYPAGDDPAQCDDPEDFLPPEAREKDDDGCGCSGSRPGSPIHGEHLLFALSVLLVLSFRRTNP